MPHLSPMNWTMFIIVTWLMLFFLCSSMFFIKNNKLYCPLQSNKEKLSIIWPW